MSENIAWSESYRIVPSITLEGECDYSLIFEWNTFLGSGSKKLARNKNRAVLEKAIAHLETNPDRLPEDPDSDDDESIPPYFNEQGEEDD